MGERKVCLRKNTSSCFLGNKVSGTHEPGKSIGMRSTNEDSLL